MRFTILAAAMLVAFSATAQQQQQQGQVSNSNSNATGNAASNAVSGSGASANTQGITFNTAPNPTNTKTTIRNVPNTVAPALTTTLTETCMGSSSIGGSGVGFGISIGSTWRDGECVRRLHAREMRAMGQNEVAAEIMCGNVQVWDARERIAKSIGNPRLACLGPRPAKEDFEVVLRAEGTLGEQVKYYHSEKNYVQTSSEVREEPAAARKPRREPEPSSGCKAYEEGQYCF